MAKVAEEAFKKQIDREDKYATARADAILLHPVAGLAILLAILFVMFQAVFAWAEAPKELIDGAFAWLEGQVTAALPDGWVRSLINDGIIAGVGSVLVFLPQIVILFFFILLLEDSGYMARTAFLLDRLMGGAGLHGRAFIPLLSSFACAIPGIMAARTIEHRPDRLTTIMIAPLVTCSARLPIYALLIGLSCLFALPFLWQLSAAFKPFAAGSIADSGIRQLLKLRLDVTDARIESFP